MTYAEMFRRIETLTKEQIADIMKMIEQGYGARGITLEYRASLKQVNAVFAYYDFLKKGTK